MKDIESKLNELITKANKLGNSGEVDKLVPSSMFEFARSLPLMIIVLSMDHSPVAKLLEKMITIALVAMVDMIDVIVDQELKRRELQQTVEVQAAANKSLQDAAMFTGETFTEKSIKDYQREVEAKDRRIKHAEGVMAEADKVINKLVMMLESYRLRFGNLPKNELTTSGIEQALAGKHVVTMCRVFLPDLGTFEDRDAQFNRITNRYEPVGICEHERFALDEDSGIWTCTHEE